MTIELVLFIALTGVLFNIISLWAIVRAREDQIETMRRAWDRLNYMEVAMSYHELIPMAWEVEDVDDLPDENRSFKEEGNVVYLENRD